jgi:hypothetical protein
MEHLGAKLVKLVDRHVQLTEGRTTGRGHLGASVLGAKCVRSVWYGWRWARPEEKHGGRLLRLFDRGQREENEFIGRLRDVGVTIYAFSQQLYYHVGSDSYVARSLGDPPPTDNGAPLDEVTDDPAHRTRAAAQGVELEQIRFEALGGHFGGSCDSIGHGLEDLFPEARLDGLGLFEYKTHGEKSFIQLAGPLAEYRKYITNPELVPFPGKGLISAKPEHYVQMQVYMDRLGLNWGLYCAVCKNTDDLYYELVYRKPELGAAYFDRAAKVIAARHPPERITSNPAWFECKFCDFREICHHGTPKAKNCRTCIYAKAEETGGWTCERYHQPLPSGFMPKGCDLWEEIPE